MLDQAFGRIAGGLVIDPGTSNTRIWIKGRGLSFEAPSVVAVDSSGGAARVVASGDEAKRMVGRTPDHIRAVQPIRDGVIADYPLAEALLRDCLLQAAAGKNFVRPQMILPVSNRMTDVERRAVQDIARSLGSRGTTLLPKAVAAAFGAGLPVHEPVANVVVDLGGGLTEIAVLSLGGLVAEASIPVSGATLDTRIAEWIRGRHNVLVGARAAEEVKHTVGSALVGQDDRSARVTGRDLTTGIPREVIVTSSELVEALESPLRAIAEGLREVLSQLGPELAGDIAESGVVLTGGGALLHNIDVWMSERTGLPVVIAPVPQRCTVEGAAALMDDPAAMARLSL